MRPLLLLLSASLLVAAARAQPVAIVNEHGGVSVEVIPEAYVRASRSGSPESRDGIATSRSPAQLLFEALPPAEGESADIEVRVPLGVPYSVRTRDGAIRLTGMVRRVRIQTAGGAIKLDVPLEVTRLNIQTMRRPPSLALPAGRKLTFLAETIRPRLRIWTLSNFLRSRDLAYGVIDGRLDSPAAISVRDWEIPRSWPVKPHTLASGAVERLLASAARRKRGGPQPGTTRPTREAAARPSGSESEALFTSEVRMVSMSVAVADSGGRPLTGLAREAFVVEEDGRRQDIRVVDPDESPFNMAILLDLSGSTSVDLEHMRQAAERLIAMAGPRDRVALYAMSGSMFRRLSSLTSDRDALLERCERLPYPTGGSPIWDTIALVYDDELALRSGERNAVVVISDGIDNRISGQSVPSNLRARRLTQAAGEMDARIYPIFLLSGERFGRGWSARARTRMEALAQRTGGRLFAARSVADIEPVLPALAREMRSVYEIAYYPANQDFDGTWRRVRIKVELPGAQVRARPGYFAD